MNVTNGKKKEEKNIKNQAKAKRAMTTTIRKIRKTRNEMEFAYLFFSTVLSVFPHIHILFSLFSGSTLSLLFMHTHINEDNIREMRIHLSTASTASIHALLVYASHRLDSMAYHFQCTFVFISFSVQCSGIRMRVCIFPRK